MATALERRLAQMERPAPQLPFHDPTHRPVMFLDDSEESNRLAESMRACPRCKDTALIIRWSKMEAPGPVKR